MNKIDKIIFYSNKHQQQAMILYTDGSSVLTSKEEGMAKVSEYISQEHIYSIDSAKIKENILFMDEKEIQQKLKKRAKVQAVKKKKKVDVKQEETNFEIKHKGIKKLALFATIATIIASNTESQWDLKNISLYDLIFNQDRLSLQAVVKPIEEQSKELTITDILSSKNMNPIKRRFFSDVWSYLIEYNKNIGSNYDDKSRKPAHKLQEVFAQYIIYNHLTEEEYSCIFGENDITTSSLKKSYKISLEQDIMFHVVQKQTSPRQKLIKTASTRNQFLQYENMLISFNREENNKRKIQKANMFFKKVRKNFTGKKNITRQDLSVESIIKAMQIMCKEHPDIKALKKKEYKQFCNLFENKKRKIIEQYQNYVLYNNNTYDKVKCSEFEEAAKKQLENENVYPKDDDSRDLYETKTFKESFRWQFKNSNHNHKNVKKMCK